MLGIIASTFLEANILIERLSPKKESTIQGKLFFEGRFNDNAATICICGIGKANAAHATALLIERFRPDRIFNIGVGGAFPSSGLSVGDIVVADKEIYGDEGLNGEDNFYTMDSLDLPLLSSDKDYFNEFPMFVPDALQDFKDRGAFLTVSACTGTVERGMELEQRFNTVCENMEGAAVAQVCIASGIPVCEIRGISNVIENRRGKALDKASMKIAAEAVQNVFCRFFADPIS
ncbi:MAG: futalosine hydrolase [Nitrospirae bacterium]|nr:MAG: futalosine hydrolase [Nitrospirota bacterium]